MSLFFIFNAILFGIGLAMDAFSVSAANGLNEPKMSHRKMVSIAGTFGGFQLLMPMVGWFCVHTIADIFSVFEKFIPWIALILLLYIGGKMLLEGIKSDKSEETEAAAVLGFAALMLQGIATSIDALSVGFTIADLSFIPALTESLIIGVVTFLISLLGIRIGRAFGTRLSGKASVLGGIILICIGLEIFIKGVIL